MLGDQPAVLTRRQPFSLAKSSRRDTVREDHAASIISAHERGLHDRMSLHRKKNAALLIERVQRGHSARLRSREEAEPQKISLARPTRLAILGCEWSHASDLARRLSRQLTVPFVSTALTDEARRELSGSSSWIVDASRSSFSECEALLALEQPPTHWVLCSIQSDGIAEARGLAAAEAVAVALATAGAFHKGSASQAFSSALSASVAPVTTLIANLEGKPEKRSAVRQHLRAWKTEMVRVYQLQPASSFVRIETGAADRYRLGACQEEILAAVLPTEEPEKELRRSHEKPMRSPAAQPAGGFASGESGEEEEEEGEEGEEGEEAEEEVEEGAPSPRPLASLPLSVGEIADDWRSRSLLARLAK